MAEAPLHKGDASQVCIPLNNNREEEVILLEGEEEIGVIIIIIMIINIMNGRTPTIGAPRFATTNLLITPIIRIHPIIDTLRFLHIIGIPLYVITIMRTFILSLM